MIESENYPGRAEHVRVLRTLAELTLERTAKYKNFDETDHPRDDHGRWTDAGGGDGVGGDEAPVVPQSVKEFEPDWRMVPDEDVSRLQEVTATWFSNAYREINRALRSADDVLMAIERDEIASLDEVFEYGVTTQRDYKVYRGIGVTHRKEKPFEIGDEFTDRGYVSTTPDLTTAEDFAELNQGYVVEIVLPKGTRTFSPMITDDMRVHDLGEGEEYPDEPTFAEPELLLQRGSRFKITGAREGDNGYKIFQARLLS